FFFCQAEDGIRDPLVTGVQTCALPILWWSRKAESREPRESHAGSERVRMRKQGETGTEESSESFPTGGELTRPFRQSNSRGKRSSKGAPTRRPGGVRVLVLSEPALTREALCML